MRAHSLVGGGGIRLHAVETGDPSAPPILLIPGTSQSHLCFIKQLESDLARDFRLVSMDLRGHGLSEKPRDAYGDSKLWADDVHAVIDTLDLDQPILSGWSYGPLAMCDYVRFYGEERVGGLHFIGGITKLGDGLMPFLGPRFVELVPGLLSDDVEVMIETMPKFLQVLVNEPLSPIDLNFMLGYNTIVPPHVRRGLFARSVDNDDLLPKLRKPVLLTHGEAEVVVLPTMARHHEDLIPDARLSWAPNVGHMPFWEDAKRFNEELRGFARQVAANRSIAAS